VISLKVGLLGYGNAGRIFHAPLIQSEPALKLHKIGSRSFADKTLPTDVTGAPIAEVIADPEIDLIVVATPNDSHAPLAMAALEAGKHVVIDKPFAVTLSGAEELVFFAAQQGKILSVFHNRRWDGGFLRARQAMDNRELGEVSYGAFHFDRFSPEIKTRWREENVPGAGILYDLGPHLLDQILVLFGIPDAVTASVACQRPGAVVDDFFHLILEFGTTRIVAHASSLMPDHTPRVSLFGSEGSLFQYGFDGQEAALKDGQRPGDPGWGKTENGWVELRDNDGAAAREGLPDGCYEAFYANIASAIAGKASLEVAPSEALNVMRVLSAAIESAKIGRRVLLDYGQI